jgi:uncharacterized membrane protein (UPF0127 family)
MFSKVKNVWIYISLVPVAIAGSFWLSQNLRLNNSVAEVTLRTPPATPAQTAQSIPVTATVQLGSETFDVEVAATEESRDLSVRWRALEDFPENRAMFVKYDPPRYLDFFAHKLKFPVELITIKRNKIINLTKDIKPCDLGKDINDQRNVRKCPIYGYGPPTLAIEVGGFFIVRAGTIDRAGIKEEQSINLKNK